MDSVAGVQQKLFWRRVPQSVKSLQPPPHPGLPQKTTLLVADKHWVLGAFRQVGPPLYMVHDPPQLLPSLVLQYVTIVVNAARLERVERSPRGLPA